MNTQPESEQARIIAWFDQTYRRKGRRYLRPVKAYYVYLELLGAKPGSYLLDVACGLGQLLLAAKEYGCQLYGTDIYGTAIDIAKNNVPQAELVRANAESLPYADLQFDRITCIGSLERVLNARRALSEIRRVAKPNAQCCFLVRNSNTLTWKYLSGRPSDKRARGHQGANTLQNWRELFKSSGFSILQILPDQYPIHLWAQWSRLSLAKVDYRRPRRSWLPLNLANEFVFLLKRMN
jgi:SAM-dependent methyltransferase